MMQNGLKFVHIYGANCPIKPYEPAEQITILIKAIRLTVPRFELDAIHSFHFSDDELNIIGLLAYSYLELGQNRTAISSGPFDNSRFMSLPKRKQGSKHCILLSGLLSSQIHQG